jgi:hypothetical protein
MEDFDKKYVGAKSNNTKRVFGNLPDWVKYPHSMAIPFNVCEYFLNFDENLTIREKLEEMTKLLDEEDNSSNTKEKVLNKKKVKIIDILFECKKQLMSLVFVENEETLKFKAVLAKFGVKENVKNNFLFIKNFFLIFFN